MSPALEPFPDTGVLISVIIPTRNRAALLQEAIEALWQQTLPPERYEIIVMDNLSSDDTTQRIHALQARSPCPLFFHVMPSNDGPASSRNAGARLARGMLLAFTDSDCRPCPEWLARGVAAFEGDVAFVAGSVLDKPEQARGPFARLTGGVTREHSAYPASNIFYRRSFFTEAGGFDESLCFRDFLDRPVECADTDLAWRLKKQRYKNAFAPEAVVYHEVENLPPIRWLFEPYRIWVVPALVKRHPELRPVLLKWGLFFCKEDAFIGLAVLGVPLAIAVRPVFLALALPYLVILPYLWWAIMLRKRPLALGRLRGFLPEAAILAGHQTILFLGLLYGSLRFRSLVL